MLLIRNAYIKPITGPDIPNGCLLAEDGRITAETKKQSDKYYLHLKS